MGCLPVPSHVTDSKVISQASTTSVESLAENLELFYAVDNAAVVNVVVSRPHDQVLALDLC